MASKKKLPRSRRCKNSEKLGLYCYCDSDEDDNITKPCPEECCKREDMPDRGRGYRSKSETSEFEHIDHIETHKRELPRHDGHANQRGPHQGPPFDWLDVLIGLSSIGFFYFDVVTDVLLARDYYHQGDMLAFGLTTTFVIGPGLITLLLNLRWYYLDFQSQQILVKNYGAERVKQTSGKLWAVRFIMAMCMMGPVMRQMEYIYNGIKSSSKKLTEKEQHRHYKVMRMEDVDACCIRMFECFLEAAPQLVLQIYILLIHHHREETWIIEGIRAAAILSSWVSLSWSMVAYQKSLRFSHEDKENMSIPGMIFCFLWRACEIGPRVIALGLFAALFHYVVFIVVGVHWLIMSGWLFCQKTQFYQNRCEERFFNIVCGYVLVFCFLNVRDGRTRYRMVVYYFITYAENWTMMGFWFYFTEHKSDWFYLPTLFAVSLGVFLQVFFQVTYYLCFHPLGRGIIKCCPEERGHYTCFESLCHDLEPEEEIYRMEGNQTTVPV